jgi:tetratricopeptide (TPR) repeat protein
MPAGVVRKNTSVGEMNMKKVLIVLLAAICAAALPVGCSSTGSGPAVSSLAVDAMNRGKALLDEGEPDAAIAELDRALAVNNNLAEAYFYRGVAYNDGKQDYDRAIADYTSAIRLNPNLAEAYYNRGVMYNDGKQDYDRAIADYTQAIRINLNYADAYYNRGVTYNDGKQDYDRAIADFEAALKINPNDANARRNLETVRQMLGR